MIAGMRIGTEMPPVPLGPRRAALLVSDLAEADRAWLLGALEPEERLQLEPLLHELAALGLQTPRAGLASRAIPVTSTSAPATPSRVGRDLARLPLRTIAARLGKEPDDVVRLALGQASDSSVRHRALGAFDSARRDRLASSLAAGTQVPADGAAARALDAAWCALPPDPLPFAAIREGLETIAEAIRDGWRRPVGAGARWHGSILRTLRPLRRLVLTDGWRVARRRASSRWGRP